MGLCFEIVYDSVHYEVAAEQGESLLSVLQRGDGTILREDGALKLEGGAPPWAVPALCAGRGSCKKCRVVVNHNGRRQVQLACQTTAEAGMVVELAYADPLVIRDSSSLSLAEVYPPDLVAVCPPDLAAVCPPDLAALCPPDLVAVCPPDLAAAQDDTLSSQPLGIALDQPLGIAVDVGTTTVVVRLLDKVIGKLHGSIADINPQAIYGADVLSRVDACSRGELGTLTTLIRETIARLVQVLVDEGEVRRSDIGIITITGNTIMEHIVAGLSPVSIGVAPFTPLSLFGGTHLLDGLNAPVWLAPAVAGYVGGDITCGLLALQALKAAEPLILIDLGTNGEIAFFDGKRIRCCATAAGPVFEGGGVYFGMSALPGAIDHVALESDGVFSLSTIGGKPARGLCGTGLVSAVASLLDAGIVDATGALVDPADVAPAYAQLLGRERIDATKQAVCYLTSDHRLFLTQGDIRGLQLAKAAVLAGIKTLLDDWDKTMADIGLVAIAGGFGAALDVSSAARIGLIPPALRDKAQAVGNTAIEGISAAVLSAQAREDLAAIVAHCDYLELSTSAKFNQHFMNCICFED